jgi:C4-dicarboxylate-specific signal transduction histidine kinase
MESRLRILHLEDDVTDSALVRETLEATGGYRCVMTRVDTQPAFCALLEQGGFDLILADNSLPSFDGLSALQLARERLPDVPFIFVSGTLDEEVAIESLKVGATDYVFKTKVSRIVPSVRRALREAEERARRSEAEKALRRSESYLIEAQRLSHTGSFGVELSSGRIHWSEETFRIFEIEPGATPTRELILQRTHPEDRALVERVVDAAARQGKEFDIEHRLLLPDGSTRHVRVVGHPLENQLEFVGAVTDVTESRRAEAERKQAQDALRATQAELARVARVMTLGELAASLAHELKQPLAAAVMNAKTCVRWLQRDTPDVVEAGDAAARLVDEATRAADIIDRVRSLYQRGAPQRDRVQVNDLVREMIALLQHEANRHRVPIRTELAERLPAVTADRVQLQQALLNLMLNGIEAMRDAPGALVITSKRAEEGQVEIAVSDSGTGLPADPPERIFEAFFSTKPEGTGMGLSISRTIVESHGGRLWATQNSGPGATFHFTLPALPPFVSPDLQEAPPAEAIP